ncbi:hypothetical protein D3C72_2308460 [compost metagenome]
MEGAELELTLSVGELRDDGRNHGPSGLSWTVSVKRPNDADRSTERAIEGECHLIGPNLGG